MVQSPQVQPLLCRAWKANTADADLEMRGGALVKLSETSPAAHAAPEQRRSAARSSSRRPQLFHTILYFLPGPLVENQLAGEEGSMHQQPHSAGQQPGN